MGLLVTLAIGFSPAVGIETLVASYEPTETQLTVSPGGADAGLTVTRVLGGAGGAPAATHGAYVLKVAFEDEDGKVEYRQDWLTPAYSLAGYEALLADVYIETPSALPGLMGIWSTNWSPPDAWEQATDIPTTTGQWTTISVDVSDREQIGLSQIWAFIFQDMPGTDGVAYVDNLRLYGVAPDPVPVELAANAFETHTELVWKLSAGPQPSGYNIYRADSEAGPFVKLNATPHGDTFYSESIGSRTQRYYYRVTAVFGETETDPSSTISARFNGLEDDELLDLVQQAAFGYFWFHGHPTCGAARDSYNGWGDTIASGGTGMGIMSIIVAAERNFITRADAADRVRLICEFLEDTSDRFHGAWPHWINGTTGATIPFSTYDDGADLVETSYVVQGLLTARQYFDGAGTVETEIRTRATRMWQAVEWDWFLRYPGGQVLYWHWSPNHGWTMDMAITGYNEAMIAYLLAIASPTHPIPASAYYNGWASSPWYANGNEYYGYKQWVGQALGGPLFFTHYSALGFDPRFWRDAFCNYYDNSRNISLIHRAYSADNPSEYEGYNRWAWGVDRERVAAADVVQRAFADERQRHNLADRGAKRHGLYAGRFAGGDAVLLRRVRKRRPVGAIRVCGRVQPDGELVLHELPLDR